MAQIVKMVDITQSYLPIDPNAYPNTLHYTGKEDSPEQGGPILPYEGYNFLPTSYGYRSYFGLDSTLTLEALPKPCDQIITFQSKTYQNMLIAFCSDGIRTAVAGANVWTHSVPLADEYTLNGKYKQYTWCVIENNLYIYRQGHDKVIKIADDLSISEFVPSFLNMLGQIGIFRGNGRLCFWDSENSIAWSSAFDLTDFTPSIENMVGNATFLGVVGRIVNVLPHGEGYVIYCTRSIVGVSYSTTGTTVWDAMSITSAGGIAHPGACCIGQNDKEHFAYTTLGVISIGHFNALSRQYDMKPILPELFDFLKESRDPVYLQCHAARFLYFSVVDPSYITGITSFTEVEFPSLAGPVVPIDSSKWATDAALPYISPKETFQFLDSHLWGSAWDVLIKDRTLPSFEAPYYCVTLQVPDIPTQAHDMGMFSKGGGMYKHYSPALEYKGGIQTIEDAFLAEKFFSADTTTTAYGDIAIIKSLYKNISSTIPYFSMAVQNPYSRQSSTLDSFYPKLYPQLLGLAAEDGDSVSDLLYNFVGSVLEYEKFCSEQYEELVQKISEIHEVEKFTRKMYATSPGLSVQYGGETTKRYFPAGTLNVTVDVHKANASFNYEAPRILDITATMKDYVELSSTLNSRVLKSTTLVPRSSVPTPYSVVIYTNFNTGTQRNSATKYYDTVPTIEELYAGLDDSAYYVMNAATGNLCKAYYDPLEVINNGSVVSEPTLIRLKDTVTGALLTGTLIGKLYKTGTLYAIDVSHGYYPSDSLTDYFAAGYHHLYQSNNFTVGDVYTKPSIEIGYHYFYRQTYWPSTYLPKGGFKPVQQIDKSRDGEIEVMANGDILLKGWVRDNGTSDPYTLQGLHVFRDIGIYEYLVEEEVIYALIPYLANNITYTEAGANYQPETAFKFAVSQRGVDTINTDSLGNRSAVNKINYYDPAIVDPGPNLPLTIPIHSPYASYNVGIDIAQENCLPWLLRNIPSGYPYQTVKGQHFMLHASGLMLSVEQPLGPILSLSDSENACYPDMDWDGWVSVDLSDFTYPPATWTMQNGAPIPAYPTLTGSLVMDMHLKKWGKQAGEFSCLLQFSPINETNNEAITYTNFGMDSGVLADGDKKIKLFAQNNVEGNMRYGKIGLYRLGFTEILEVTLNFRTKATVSIIIDGSIDGRDLDLGIQHKEDFVDVRQAVVKCHVNARWHTISIAGNFDLQYMEFRGIMAARR